VALDRAQEEKVVARFKADRDEEYRKFLDICAAFEAEVAKETAIGRFTYLELQENDVDLTKLEGWLEKIRKLDFYGAPLAARQGRPDISFGNGLGSILAFFLCNAGVIALVRPVPWTLRCSRSTCRWPSSRPRSCLALC